MPHIITDLERSKEFKAVRALLLYESGGDSAFCTVHDVESGTLRPGRPITAGEVREALARISGMSERICILPPNVLVSGNGILAWHRPAKPATLWFSMLSKHGKPDRKHPLSKLSGSKFPMPPLLWMVKGGRLHLWAMPHGQRPTGKTRLHPTPFWNCYETGGVCQGTMAALPENPSPASIPQIEAAFFQSNFTHGGLGVKARPGLTTHAELWRHARKARRFPVELLRKSTTTLAKALA